MPNKLMMAKALPSVAKPFGECDLSPFTCRETHEWFALLPARDLQPGVLYLYDCAASKRCHGTHVCATCPARLPTRHTYDSAWALDKFPCKAVSAREDTRLLAESPTWTL